MDKKKIFIVVGICVLFALVLVFANLTQPKQEEETQTTETPKDLIELGFVPVENIEGKICKISDDEIEIELKETDGQEQQTTTVFTKDLNLLNYRTNEGITADKLKVGDYVTKGYVIRNITGDELIQEDILNLANCYSSGYLICYPNEIKTIEKDEGENCYYVTFEMCDTTNEVFGNNEDFTFDLKVKADENTNIPTSGTKVTVDKLKEETQGFMYWIELDKDTVNNQTPYLKTVEIYDK